MRFTKLAIGILFLFAAAAVQAQGPASIFYLTAGFENHNIRISGSTATISNQAIGSESAIAVGNEVRTLGVPNSNAFQGAQYDLNFVDTGTRITNPPNVFSIYDGTTDGSFNYAVDYGTPNTNRNVYRFDRNWQNPTSLFTLSDGHLGITYDGTNDSLWISNFNGTDVTEYSKTGTVLRTFNTGFNSITSLALDSADNTLWMGSQNTNGTFYQYSKSGDLLQTITYANLTSQNTLGGEFAIAAVPEPGLLASCALVSLVGGSLLLRRRQSHLQS